MRVVIIEVGHWHATMHLMSLQKAGAQVIGVSDGDPAIAEEFARKVGCPAFQDYRIMLETTCPEFVMCLGRHVDMPKIARDLLDAGIPFAIEKPIGISADQLSPLVEIARQRRAFVAVPFVNRYSPLWMWLDRLEQSRRVGIRSHAHFRIINGPPSRYERDRVSWMLNPAVSGGGCMRNLGIHTADAFLHFARGEEVEVLSAAMTYRVHGESVEEMGAALLCSKSGIIGTIEAGYSFASMTAGDYEWRVSSENCYLVDDGKTLRVATLDDDRIQNLPLAGQDSRYEQFGTDTLERLRSGQPPIATLEDCYRAARVVDEIYEKAVHIGGGPHPRSEEDGDG